MEQKIRILYAEDNTITASAIQQILERVNFSVETAPDGNAAWEAYRRLKPDILLLDLEMPGKSGTDLIRMVRENDQHTPIVLYSTHAETENEVLAINLGANDFVDKARPPEVLISRLKEIYRRISCHLNAPYIYILSERTIFNSAARVLTINGQAYRMRGQDARFLHLLCARGNEVAGIPYLLEGMWDKATDCKRTELKKYASHVRSFLKEDSSLQIHYVNDHLEPEGYRLTNS